MASTDQSFSEISGAGKRPADIWSMTKRNQMMLTGGQELWSWPRITPGHHFRARNGLPHGSSAQQRCGTLAACNRRLLRDPHHDGLNLNLVLLLYDVDSSPPCGSGIGRSAQSLSWVQAAQFIARGLLMSSHSFLTMGRSSFLVSRHTPRAVGGSASRDPELASL